MEKYTNVQEVSRRAPPFSGAAGYASAADVTLFGVVDTGLIYTHQSFDDSNEADVNKFSMDSGVSSASRFGLKGTEELGNGMKVSFQLENGFQSDSGALKSEKRIFDREASVSVYSDFGTLSMGRMGGVGSVPARMTSSSPRLMPSTAATTTSSASPPPTATTTWSRTRPRSSPVSRLRSSTPSTKTPSRKRLVKALPP